MFTGNTGMTSYRRNFIPSASYFFTVNLDDRRQRRYWEHTLRDEGDFDRHVDYIHVNPVKHGHAASVEAWPYSSYHRIARAAVAR